MFSLQFASRLQWIYVFIVFTTGPVQVPLIEDLEQIFMRSWRESHLSEIRQYQQPQTPATQGRHYGIEVRQRVFFHIETAELLH